jgi:hypothetical protein
MCWWLSKILSFLDATNYIYMSTHQVYAPDFTAHVRLKHRLAELQFSHLYKFDNDYVGSGSAVKDTKD